ncbi:DsbA family protein [Sphingomonas piscis]|uniref:DsbA family protein n=1 Tax=Sphingomonas piscis TaxID=2714943 RepID=A0A6G7YRH8_9SPHN|nr:DsbA family protein [Sphingomonas piscis]QIK79343.1 DsbA family protein [Sphingomonas piscis]
MSEHKGRSPWVPGIVGGVLGSVLTAGLLVVAAPQWLGPRLVREALVEQPDILVQASDALRDRQYEPVLTAYRQPLETAFASSWKGSAKPDVTLVEFFDYACTYCKASNPDIERLIAEDKGLRVVYREFPILGQASLDAAKVSLAASRAGRFAQFHDALYAAGRPGPETIALAARAAGIPDAAAADPAAEAELKRNYQMAQQLGANATPLFIIGNKVLNGAVGYDALKEAIAAARRTKQ